MVKLILINLKIKLVIIKLIKLIFIHKNRIKNLSNIFKIQNWSNTYRKNYLKSFHELEILLEKKLHIFNWTTVIKIK